MSRAKYETAAQSIAEALEEDSDAVLERYEEAVRRATFPGPDCLGVEEIEAAVLGQELPEERRDHVRQCRGCAQAVEAARPDANKREQFLQAVRAARRQASAQREPEEAREYEERVRAAALITS